jgi:adenylate cyclase
MDRYQETLDWLFNRAFEKDDVARFLGDFGARLLDFGMGFQRIHIGVQRRHPLYAVGAYTWRPGEPVEIDNYRRGITKGSAQEATWRQSPMRWVYESGQDEGYLVLEEGGRSDDFPMLKDARKNGATAYLLQLSGLGPRTIAMEDQEGVALSYILDMPGGFSAEDLDFMRQIRLPISAYMKTLGYRQMVDDILDAYLGKLSGTRVLEGQMQRGDGDQIEAVIVFSDLRGSSSLAEHYGMDGFLDILNRYFEVTAGSFLDHDGEVLRFIGDASLAIFPYDKFGGPEAACAKALEAAQDAVARGAAMNAARMEEGALPIGFGIGLHVGTVMYGNIGTPDRIEFSVIGRAANEAARIEAQCKELDRQILASKAFANLSNAKWQSHGVFELRNIGEGMEIVSPK